METDDSKRELSPVMKNDTNICNAELKEHIEWEILPESPVISRRFSQIPRKNSPTREKLHEEEEIIFVKQLAMDRQKRLAKNLEKYQELITLQREKEKYISERQEEHEEQEKEVIETLRAKMRDDLRNERETLRCRTMKPRVYEGFAPRK